MNFTKSKVAGYEQVYGNRKDDFNDCREKVWYAFEEFAKVKSDKSMENDGIGAYEYHGARGFDAGADYMICNLELTIHSARANFHAWLIKSDEDAMEKILHLIMCYGEGSDPFDTIEWEVYTSDDKESLMLDITYTAEP